MITTNTVLMTIKPQAAFKAYVWVQMSRGLLSAAFECFLDLSTSQRLKVREKEAIHIVTSKKSLETSQCNSMATLQLHIKKCR